MLMPFRQLVITPGMRVEIRYSRLITALRRGYLSLRLPFFADFIRWYKDRYYI